MPSSLHSPDMGSVSLGNDVCNGSTISLETAGLVYKLETPLKFVFSLEVV